MFSQACGKNSVRGVVSQHAMGRGCVPLDPGGAPLGLGVCASGSRRVFTNGHPPPEQTPPGQTTTGRQPPLEMIIKAGGTHPTGMNSCFNYHLLVFPFSNCLGFIQHYPELH